MPQFEHDCKRCEFLATIELPEWTKTGLARVQTYDLYHCPGVLGGTLIARYSSEGPDYSSMSATMIARLRVEGRNSPQIPLAALALDVALSLAEILLLTQKEISYKSLWEPSGQHTDPIPPPPKAEDEG